MIDLYDGNNVMRRAMEKHGLLPGQKPMSLRMRYEHCVAQPAGTQIWCWDGYNHNERRREIYPKYKTNREPMGMDMFAQIKLWKECLEHSTAVQIQVEGWEADDVIGTLARRFAANGQRVTIHTNDMDYGQLLDLGNVDLHGVNMKGVPPRWIPLYKAMVGDKSDAIDGIPGFGPVRWIEMEDHWPQIERAVRQGDPEGFVGLPFKPAVLAWLSQEENVELLQKMLLVTHLQNVPDDELEGGIKIGNFNRQKAHDLLRQFFL